MGLVVATWGVLCVLMLLTQAVWRLTPLAVDALRSGLSPVEITILVVWTVVAAYAEGYRGFQKAFSVRVVNRAFHLGHHPRPLHVVLALPYCMALMHATRRGLIRSWVLLVSMICLVVLVKLMPQPWRGIVDAGVVVGLAWGAVSIVVLFLRGAMFGPAPPRDLPEPAVAQQSA